jgi:hypothetical protein
MSGKIYRVLAAALLLFIFAVGRPAPAAPLSVACVNPSTASGC